MRRICTICARGGSQGVKGKNLRHLNGVSVIEITVTQALKSGLFEQIALSSDSDEILAEAQRVGVTNLVKRPVELATSEAGKVPAIQHCVREVEAQLKTEFDIMVDLDVTSPLRRVEDINGAVMLLEETKADKVITGSPARRSPYFNLVEEQPNGTVNLAKIPDRPVLRRQDVPRCFDMNASIYVWRRDSFWKDEKLFSGQVRLYEMPEERSLDIDSELDFEIVSYISEKQNRFRGEW